MGGNTNIDLDALGKPIEADEQPAPTADVQDGAETEQSSTEEE